MTEYVQPIAVSKTGCHEEIVMAVAVASVYAFAATPQNPNWAKWLDGPFTKTVRRGTPTQFQVCEEQAAFVVEIGEARAAADTPRPAKELGLPWSKMQVSGLERERKGWPFDPEISLPTAPTIYINPYVEMSTGKTAAQVAHGLFAWVLNMSDQQWNQWMEWGAPVRVTDERQYWDEITQMVGGIQIVDAGRTEIDPGTMSVFVIDGDWE